MTFSNSFYINQLLTVDLGIVFPLSNKIWKSRILQQNCWNFYYCLNGIQSSKMKIYKMHLSFQNIYIWVFILLRKCNFARTLGSYIQQNTYNTPTKTLPSSKTLTNFLSEFFFVSECRIWNLLEIMNVDSGTVDS